MIKEPDNIIGGAIAVYNNIFDDSDLIIETAESMNEWRDATVYSQDTGDSSVSTSVRSNKILDVNWTAETTHSLFYEMDSLVESYIASYAMKYETSYKKLESSQILKYDVGEFYKQHYDTGPQFPRVISALLYLNDVESGGETEFVHFNIKVKPKAGRLVIFPSNYAYAHIAHPPKKGYKYVTVYWTEEILFHYDNNEPIII